MFLIIGVFAELDKIPGVFPRVTAINYEGLPLWCQYLDLEVFFPQHSSMILK